LSYLRRIQGHAFTQLEGFGEGQAAVHQGLVLLLVTSMRQEVVVYR
jgi:hypothetical protein